MNYPATTPQKLLSEFFSIIEEKSEVVISLTKGALKGLELEACAKAEPQRLEIEWILRAHIGTIEKIHYCQRSACLHHSNLYRRRGTYSKILCG